MTVIATLIDCDGEDVGVTVCDTAGEADGETDADMAGVTVPALLGDVEAAGDAVGETVSDGGTMHERSVAAPAAPAPPTAKLVHVTPAVSFTHDEPPPPPEGR